MAFKSIKQKNLKLEDLYKATKYLELFNAFKHKLPVKDIYSIKSLPELYLLVKPFDTNNKKILPQMKKRNC